MTFVLASDYLEDQMLLYLTDQVPDNALPGVELALFIGSPGDDGISGSEVTTQIRAAGRVGFTFGAPTLNGSNWEIANTAVIDFGNSDGTVEGTVNYLAIYDTSISNNLIGYAPLVTPLTISIGNPVSVGANGVIVRISDQWASMTQQAILNWIRGTNFPSILERYVALYTSAPNYNNTGTEVTTQIRVAGRPTAAMGWNGSGASGVTHLTSNDGKVDFGTSANTLGSQITHYGIFDAASGGNLLFWGALGATATVNAGDSVSFEDQQLKIRTS